jgi:glycosyltransferase involved in cell wall biosynthesis
MHIVMTVTSNLVHDNRVRREAETLAAHGYDVTVFSHIAPADVDRLGWQDHPRLQAVPVGRPAWQRQQGLTRTRHHAADLLRWGGSAAILEAAQDRAADVYHAHDLDTLPAAAALAQHHRSRLVYDSHELFVDQLDLGPRAREFSWPSRLKQWVARQNYARLERALVGRADGVIAVSQASAAELARRYAIAQPTVLLNTPPFQDWQAGSTLLRDRLGLAVTQRIVLLQGAVLPDRGQVELVESLVHLPAHVVLVFLGFNLGTFQPAVRAAVTRLGLEARVHFLDALPASELLAATASADVGMILLAGHNKNHRYTLPNKLFEYMMAGLPFVATDWPELGRLVRLTGAGVTIPHLAPPAIAAGILEVLADDTRRATLRAAGLHAARTEYNWEHQSQNLLAVYHRLQDQIQNQMQDQIRNQIQNQIQNPKSKI